MTKPVLEKMLMRSTMVGECLEWNGQRDRRGGYGRMYYKGRSDAKVHRVAWIERHGQPPAGKPNVLHRCDNPPCWRDEHLYVGTQADNVADMVARDRLNNPRHEACKKGHPFTPDNVQMHHGRRECRICNRARWRESAARRRERVST